MLLLDMIEAVLVLVLALAVDDLVLRLQHNRTEIVAPPPVQIHRSPVPDLNQTLLLDKQNLLYTLRADFQCMVDHAK